MQETASYLIKKKCVFEDGLVTKIQSTFTDVIILLGDNLGVKNILVLHVFSKLSLFVPQGILL